MATNPPDVLRECDWGDCERVARSDEDLQGWGSVTVTARLSNGDRMFVGGHRCMFNEDE